MTVPLPNSSSVFLGYHFTIETPLELQDYTSSISCISRWVLLVPPADIPNEALKAAREEFVKDENWIQDFSAWQDHAEVDDDLDKFAKWWAPIKTNSGSTATEGAPTEGAGTEGISEITATESTALLIMSHHDTNKLVFDPVTGIPAVFSSGIRRTFAVPSVAIINACGTAEPGAFDFVRELNRAGVNSIVATNTEVDAQMAGRFASILLGLIRDHSGDPRYTLEVAKFDAVNALSKVPKGKPYGPRALIFSLLGNGNVKLCAPPKI
jgi:hypothetical protein